MIYFAVKVNIVRKHASAFFLMFSKLFYSLYQLTLVSVVSYDQNLFHFKKIRMPSNVHLSVSELKRSCLSNWLLSARADQRVLVPPTRRIASLNIPVLSDSDDGDYLCTASSAAGTIEEPFTIRVERGDTGDEPTG